MKNFADNIKDLFNKKLLLYRDLEQIIRQEREYIAESNIDSLWEISLSKQELVSKIEQIRHNILTILSKASIVHDMDVSSFSLNKIFSLMPAELGEKTKSFRIPLIAIKDKIYNLSGENKEFVEKYLETINELVEIISNAGNPEYVYNCSRYFKENSKTSLKTSLLLSKEI